MFGRNYYSISRGWGGESGGISAQESTNFLDTLLKQMPSQSTSLARHTASSGQSQWRERVYFLDGRSLSPITFLQQRHRPAFSPGTASQEGAIITNSLHREGE